MRLLRILFSSFPTLPVPFCSALGSSFCNSGTEHLGAEESALSLLNDLLIHALRRMVHDDCAGLVIDLGVDSGVADQVDNPFLTFALR